MSETKWQELRDSIFRPSSNPPYNASIYFHRFESLGGKARSIPDIRAAWSTYARGYWRAAESLIGCLSSSPGGGKLVPYVHESECLVYPIVFCYRQYLELTFKDLIQQSERLLDTKLDWQRQHNLKQLWAKLQPYMEEIWECQPDARMVGDIVDIFDRIDQGSYSFRYPVNNDGELSLPTVRHVNLQQLSAAMNQVRPFLDGASSDAEDRVRDRYQRLGEQQQEELNSYPPEPDYP